MHLQSHSSETQTKAPSDVKPVVMLKTRDDSRPVQPSNLNTSTQSIPGMLATEHAPTQPMYQIQKNPSILTAAGQEGKITYILDLEGSITYFVKGTP